MTPEQLKHEKRAVLAEIDAAFADVSREGGISWSQARAMDLSEGPGRVRDARELDTDKHWNELVADPAWSFDIGVGGFAFLDPIGFRYYLPAAMKQCILHAQVDSHLPWSQLELRPGDESSQLKRWSLFDARQVRCIARFLRCMDAMHTAACIANHPELLGTRDDPTYWQAALLSYWEQAGI